MFKRFFFGMLGLGAGVALGVAGVRKVEQTRRRLTPEQLSRAASMRVGSLAEQLAGAMEVGRRVAAAREAELRETLMVRPPR